MSRRNKLCTQQSVVNVIVEGGVEMEKCHALKSKRINGFCLKTKRGMTWFDMILSDMTWHGTKRARIFSMVPNITRATPLRQPLWRSLDRGKPKSPLEIRGGKEVCQGRRIQTKFMARIPRGKHGFGESYQDAEKFVRKQRNCERTRRVKRINSW